MTNPTVWKAATCALIALTLAPIRVEAAITSVTVNASSDYDNARGYTYAEITVHGTVDRADGSVGVYAVPAVLIYPRHRRANRVGVVDWVNSAYYHFFPATTEFGTFQFTLLATEHYLFDEGYTYVSIQWDKAVTEIFGPAAPIDGQAHNHLVYGSIDRSADAWEILLDAARLLKDPSVYPGNDGPRPVATVLSSGYSQGAGAQLELLAEGLDPDLVYDGHLIQMIGLACFKREDVAPHFGFFGDCSPLPTNGQHAPVIVLASETDMLIFHPTVLGFGKGAFFTRNPTNPNWRQYRDGRDLTSARADPAARPPQSEQRRRTADLPRRLGEPDQMDEGQPPRESSTVPIFQGERRRDRCLRADDGCRWPLRGRRSTTARRVDDARARRRCAARPAHAAQPTRTRSVQSVRVHQWDLHAIQRR